MDDKYNPFEDKTIHTTQPAKEYAESDRQAFNDVMKHYDAVNGFQNPKRLNQLPQSLRQVFRWVLILYLLAFFGFMLYEVFDLLM